MKNANRQGAGGRKPSGSLLLLARIGIRGGGAWRKGKCFPISRKGACRNGQARLQARVAPGTRSVARTRKNSPKAQNKSIHPPDPVLQLIQKYSLSLTPFRVLKRFCFRQNIFHASEHLRNSRILLISPVCQNLTDGHGQ